MGSVFAYMKKREFRDEKFIYRKTLFLVMRCIGISVISNSRKYESFTTAEESLLCKSNMADKKVYGRRNARDMN